MILKIIKNLIKENKTLLLFMMITSVLTAVIGCFCFGIYQNYHIGLLEGEATATTININAVDWSGYMTSRTDLLTYDTSDEELNELFRYNNFSTITKGDIIEVLENIPESMYDDIMEIYCEATLENDLLGLAPFDFYVKLTDDGIVSSIDSNFKDEYYLTDEEYINGDRHIVLNETFLHADTVSLGTGTAAYDSDWARKIDGVGDTVTVCGVEYTVSNIIPNSVTHFYVGIPLTSLPDDTLMRYKVSIQFNNPVTYYQYMTISDIVNEHISDDAYVEEMDLSAVSDLAYYRTIIFITGAVGLLFAVNLAVLYRYIIECNKKRITVFRLCGSTRGKCIRLFLAQSILVITPVFSLSLFAFDKALYPKMVELFPNAIDCLNFKRYVCVLLGYVIVSSAVLLFMLVRNIGRKLNFTEANL